MWAETLNPDMHARTRFSRTAFLSRIHESTHLSGTALGIEDHGRSGVHSARMHGVDGMSADNRVSRYAGLHAVSVRSTSL